MKIFFSAFGVAFSGALMPGPLLTVNIKESLKRGFWAGPQLILGHALLEGVLITGLVLGLGGLLKAELSQGIISVFGGVFLFWMAWGMLRYEGSGELSGGKEEIPEGTHGGKSGLPPVVAGAVVSLSNPYWTLWWATLGRGVLVQAEKLGIIGVLLFFFGHILADFLWYSAVSFVVSSGKKWLTPKIYRSIIIFCGLFLIYLAVDFFRLGLKTLWL
ncbi:MAG: LysE family transporter [Firmicutes bacterium]|nr:LysE family transporter [Bacillota bacterium]